MSGRWVIRVIDLITVISRLEQFADHGMTLTAVLLRGIANVGDD